MVVLARTDSMSNDQALDVANTHRHAKSGAQILICILDFATIFYLAFDADFRVDSYNSLTALIASLPVSCRGNSGT